MGEPLIGLEVNIAPMERASYELIQSMCVHVSERKNGSEPHCLAAVFVFFLLCSVLYYDADLIVTRSLSAIMAMNSEFVGLPFWLLTV